MRASALGQFGLGSGFGFTWFVERLRMWVLVGVSGWVKMRGISGVRITPGEVLVKSVWN